MIVSLTFKLETVILIQIILFISGLITMQKILYNSLKGNAKYHKINGFLIYLSVRVNFSHIRKDKH